ncbi:Mpo1-like protein [Tundrisphaera sp. TA3]|uniref:Mpo1-like protein n=1 Tax=Tundrisphaera sp. TA3 TaxID=3435775 RepID=UPI003EBCC8C2
MIYTPQPPSPIVSDWIARHRDPRSFLLHLIGIPATILGVLLLPVYTMLLSYWIFLLAVALFLGGYCLQFLGHALDGSEPGEIRALRRAWARRRQTRFTAAPERAA